MSQREAEPNRLREGAPPNRLRGFDAPTPPSWLAGDAARRASVGAGAPRTTRTANPEHRLVSARLVRRIGLVIAAAGLLPFLNADFQWQEVGLAMMCGGIGITLLAASSGLLRAQTASGTAGTPMLAVLFGAPGRMAVPVLGGGLMLLALLLLLDLAQRG